MSTPFKPEKTIGETDILITKTDAQGHITYANREFMTFCDFRADRIIGQTYRVVRHPEMPSGIFQMMWQTLKNKEEFIGIIRNLTANQEPYWAFTNITAHYDEHGQIVGYHSVYRCPSPTAITTILPLYQHMQTIEAQSAPNDHAAAKASVQWLLDTIQQRYQHTYMSFMLYLANT